MNAGRGLPTKKEAQPWWGRLFDPEGGDTMGGAPPKPRKITCYTFGCPRVGNKALADLFNGLPIDAYRVVNGADIVARLPRHGNAVGGLFKRGR